MARIIVLALLSGCGGRSVTAPDAGGDGHSGGDGDADVEDGGEGPVPCVGRADNCPWELPICCALWPDGRAYCTDDPEPYLSDIDEDYEWDCLERPPEGSTVPFDCIDRATYRHELCPDGYPHCCRDLYGAEVCVDRVLLGWPCGD